MSTSRPPCAKIMQHAQGLGAPSTDQVRARAQEIAVINGHEDFNEDDWQEAKRELHGGHEFNDGNGESEMSALISGHDMIAGSLGHHVENLPADENENLGEELIAEGMDEAVHEQMLASRREDAAEDAQ